ncbi:transcriptional regulator [Mycobacterium gallinarum]|uniref:Transcriptional regulator n=1 Tax=Mycobacterium gallinarum TaxID=39689 RepID=A0A9W4FEX9_9MYCO|nr:transcriptional regulator [Mycobacterium gallinarum]
MASTGDMAVMRTSGSEAEAALGFSGLHQLLRPALHLIDRLPAPQAEALAVALMLRDGPAPARFAVGAATLSLISRYAEEGPLLVLVDDAHLIDAPSAEALTFVARRLLADAVAMLICTRPEPGAVLAESDLPVVDLGGLDLSAASALIETTSATPAPADLVAKLHHLTLGSPLAIVELARDIERVRSLPPELPVPVPQTVVEAFGQRITALPDASRLALLVAVVADGDLALISRAVRTVGTTIDQLGGAEAIGVLQIVGGRAKFRHPLVRSAVYATADGNARRAVHRAVADALPAASHDRRAWHLSQATIGPDDAVASDLTAVAERARAQGAYGAATLASERSAELTDDHSLRATRLIAAGDSAWLAGRPDRARELLDAAALTATPSAQAEIDALRGNIALRTGSLRDAYQLLTTAAERTTTSNPETTLALLADAVTATFYLCDTAAGSATADRMEALLGVCPTASTRVRAMFAIGVARVLAGDDGVRWLRRGVDALRDEPRAVDDPHRPDWAIIGTLFLRECAAGRDTIRRLEDERRAQTAIGSLPNLLFHTARDAATTDRWQAAATQYDESVTLARETGQSTDLAASLSGLAWLQARMGHTDECRANAGEALELAHRHQIVFAGLWARFALGDLALAEADPESAVAHFVDLEKILSDISFQDVDLAPGPELTEAQVRQGQIVAARATARDYLQRALEKDQPWALARAYRATALVANDAGERCAQFEKALQLHELNPDRYEVARTRLAFGSALRRDKARTAARPHLRSALEEFDRLGARPWAEFASGELDATGERLRRNGEGRLDVLTSQELRIAGMLGGGATTKEAAAALFLSPKTVEYHLRHIYQKLDIRSRDELRSVMAEEGQAADTLNSH